MVSSHLSTLSFSTLFSDSSFLYSLLSLYSPSSLFSHLALSPSHHMPFPERSFLDSSLRKSSLRTLLPGRVLLVFVALSRPSQRSLLDFVLPSCLFGRVWYCISLGRQWEASCFPLYVCWLRTRRWRCTCHSSARPVELSLLHSLLQADSQTKVPPTVIVRHLQINEAHTQPHAEPSHMKDSCNEGDDFRL